MIQTTPGAQFVAKADEADTGLVGTISVGIITLEGDVVVPATTAGITENPEDPGEYSVTLTAPLTPGTYLVRWTVSEDDTADTDLQVLGAKPSRRTYEDALRSVRRYVAAALGSPPWRVLLAADPGRLEVPYAVVNEPDGFTQGRNGVETDQLSMPVVVMAYPEQGVRPSESKLAAIRVATVLQDAITYGVPDAAVPSVVGHRQMIPLWNYAPEDAPLPINHQSGNASDRGAQDYVRVADGWSVRVRPEASEDELFVAVLQMRVQWFRGAGLRSTGRVLRDVLIQYE
jgi:hypothetical protein